jgi:hypothetical protein
MEGGKTANYWPGFVDALTNVVIAMVFVIVVLAIALSFAAQMMGKKMADELTKAKAAVVAAQAQAANPRPATADDMPPPPTLEPRTLIEVKARAPMNAASAGLRAIDRGLRLVFADNALALDKDAADQLHAALAPRRATAASARVDVVATGPSMALSDNQRNAYIRVLAVRNELIDEGFAPDHIAVRIDTATAAARASVTVSFPASTGLASGAALPPASLTAPLPAPSPVSP